MPTVSIIMASYNHEKYIAAAIESVLKQTYQDFELIIIDDCSSDNSIDAIKQFNDVRIKVTVLPENQGQFVATNIGLTQASGKYIGILNSDDAFLPEKTAKQVAYLEANPEVGAVFSRAEMLYETQKNFNKEKNLYHSIFDQPNRTRFEWLNYFFFYGNCLCHPSVLLRRECHDELGFYDPRFANCADFQFWIRLAAKYDIHILQEKLTQFRILQNNGNMSGNSVASQKRMRWEDYQAKLLYFDNLLSDHDFFAAFPEAKKFIVKQNAENIKAYLLARLALEKNDAFLDALGLRVLFEMMQDANTALELKKNYNFTYKQLIYLTGNCNPFHVKISSNSSFKRWLKTLYHSIRYKLSRIYL